MYTFVILLHVYNLIFEGSPEICIPPPAVGQAPAERQEVMSQAAGKSRGLTPAFCHLCLSPLPPWLLAPPVPACPKPVPMVPVLPICSPPTCPPSLTPLPRVPTPACPLILVPPDTCLSLCYLHPRHLCPPSHTPPLAAPPALTPPSLPLQLQLLLGSWFWAGARRMECMHLWP